MIRTLDEISHQREALLGVRGMDPPAKVGCAALRRAGLPTVTRFHDLRHSYGSLSLATGTDIVTSSHNMGHSSPRVTESVYLYSSLEGRRLVQERLGRALAPTNTSSTSKRLYNGLTAR